MRIGPWEIIAILAVVLIIFGTFSSRFKSSKKQNNDSSSYTKSDNRQTNGSNYCPQCGKPVQQGAKYCTECGHSL